MTVKPTHELRDRASESLGARVLRGVAGVLPVVGAIAGTGWMLVYYGANPSGELSGYVWLAVLLAQAAFLVMQAVLWLRYEPFRADDDAPLPSLSVIIPAYNEGPMVERSIRSVAQADYPEGKLEIIVVDDGSRDDSYFHMARLRRAYPGLVRVIRFPGNRGKRAALDAGFRAAKGEIVMTLDSDSEIERQTLRAMVAPFQVEPRVGAVAGRVAVLNRNNLIGRMLEVQYALAFDFGRAAQSAYRTVACCPGALSAFRREIVVPHLEEWLDQRFLGRPVSHGEDQALTNIVLRQGYDTVYQRTAVVHTLAPQRYRQLTKMLTRWDRSYIVEGFSFAKFMFTRYRRNNRVLPIVNFVVSNARLLLLYYGLVQLPGVILTHPGILPNFTVAFVIAAFLSSLYYLQTERSLRFLYGVAYAFYAFLFLQWTLPWALVTVRDERWGTR